MYEPACIYRGRASCLSINQETGYVTAVAILASTRQMWCVAE